MKNKSLIQYIDEYFNKYLSIERNISPHTILSYKTTFKLLLNYLIKEKEFKINQINFENVTKDIIREFLDYIEENNSTKTRNQRLAVIKSFFKYIIREEPTIIFNVQQILNIKKKKYNNQVFEYLTKEELKLFLDNIDTSSYKGVRDYALIVLLYDSAIRVSEIINVEIKDLFLNDNPKIIITGKGNKTRVVPIMNNTKKLLEKYIDVYNLKNEKYLFKGNKGKASTKMVTHIITKYTKLSGIKKKITPHSFRHSRAIHLLEDGINIFYIKDILGHESIETTQNYIKISTELKRKVIENVYPIKKNKDIPIWKRDENILKELLNI